MITLKNDNKKMTNIIPLLNNNKQWWHKLYKVITTKIEEIIKKK
jgi:hypothetical protein